MRIRIFPAEFWLSFSRLVYEVGTAGADARLKNFHLRADTGIDFREAYWDESESGK